MLFSASIQLLNPSGLCPNSNEDDVVDGPTVLCPTESRKSDRGALQPELLLPVPTQKSGLLGFDICMNLRLEAALPAMILGP
jgi:hypothetical protein